MAGSPLFRSLLAAALAAALFVPLFILRGIGPFDFWWWMSAAIVLLVGLGAGLDADGMAALRRDLGEGVWRKIGLGLLAAAALYAVFFIGNWASRLLLPFAGADIGQVYRFKAGAPVLRIVLSMALIIGPGEELFWRAYLQRRWQKCFGPFAGWLAATALYALVHAGSGNPMLVLAAAVCGLFWGFLYMRTGSPLLVAVSHTVWDVAVFLVLPFRS
jgi:membrane protease YdiL (CAAX protease family)